MFFYSFKSAGNPQSNNLKVYYLHKTLYLDYTATLICRANEDNLSISRYYLIFSLEFYDLCVSYSCGIQNIC